MNKSITFIPLSTLRILIAEDQDVLREIFVSMLRSFNVREVIDVPNGSLAWNRLMSCGTSHIDLLITDLCMPSLTGSALIKNLRESQLPHLKNIPVIIITGDESYRNIREVGRYEVSACLIKPFSAEVLRAAVEEVIALRQFS